MTVVCIFIIADNKINDKLLTALIPETLDMLTIAPLVLINSGIASLQTMNVDLTHPFKATSRSSTVQVSKLPSLLMPTMFICNQEMYFFWEKLPFIIKISYRTNVFLFKEIHLQKPTTLVILPKDLTAS